MATGSSHTDPTLYLYTSLTAGSSHIITATSRMETILKANKIPFVALDCATDEKARMLWGRRSKGKKLPGLVKYGTILGDLEQIEEWNEYGELKDQIESADEFGAPISTTLSSIPPSSAAAQKPDPPSRASSETRHISISEPTERDRQASPSPGSTNRAAENPMTMTMRQLGAEAAAKAGQRKASAGNTKAAPVPTSNETPSFSTAQTPTPAATKMSADAEEPTTETPEVTAAKTPAQLESEGATRTSMEKVAIATGGSEAAALSAPTPDISVTETSTSTEEQLLEARRNSSMTKVPSRLASSTTADDPDITTKQFTDDSTSSTARPSASPVVTTPPSSIPNFRDNDPEPRPQFRTHRGSSISDASKEEIAAAEARNAIKEEEEEDDEEDTQSKLKKSETAITDDTSPTVETKTVQSDPKIEEAVTGGSNPQDQDAKDAESAGKSVGD